MEIKTLEEFDKNIGNFAKTAVETYEDMSFVRKSNREYFNFVCGEEKFERFTIDYNRFLEFYLNLLRGSGNELDLSGKFKSFEIVVNKPKSHMFILNFDWTLLYAHLLSIHAMQLAFESNNKLSEDQLYDLIKEPYWNKDSKEKATYFINEAGIKNDVTKRAINGLFKRIEVIQENLAFMAELVNLNKEEVIKMPGLLQNIREMYIPNNDAFKIVSKLFEKSQ